ncbi:MAG: hypothetical protein ACI81Q_000512 [Paracoccaceae bacterium]|jgi:uncharacterized protein (DUF2235 family)
MKEGQSLRNNGFWARLRGFRNAPTPDLPESYPACTHVILLDGTMSTLIPGEETNIGLTYRLLSELDPADNTLVYYEPGIQWRGIKRALEVIAGIGINRTIKRSYLFLARNYRPGDQIYLMGYSRGAFAARSLAGLIDTIGLLRKAQITEEMLERVYHLYRCDPRGAEARALKLSRCHDGVSIKLVGVYDTVRALGIRWPIVWRLVPEAHSFHNHTLGPATLNGRHALALNEPRFAYSPVLWQVLPERLPDIQQMWFRGTHGDIGGHLGGWNAARPLSNIPLIWMLSEAEALGLRLPTGWQDRFPIDPLAPSVGSWQGWAKILWRRRRRKIGLDPSEFLHPSAKGSTTIPLPLPLPGVVVGEPAR